MCSVSLLMFHAHLPRPRLPLMHSRERAVYCLMLLFSLRSLTGSAISRQHPCNLSHTLSRCARWRNNQPPEPLFQFARYAGANTRACGLSV